MAFTNDGHDMNNARKAWDEEQIARAVGFTTCRFQGRGIFDTRPFGDLASALADAQGDRRAIVYAVTPEAWTIHIINGNEITMNAIIEATAAATYDARKTAARAARKALGSDKISGVHFRVVDAPDGRFTWEPTPAEDAPLPLPNTDSLDAAAARIVLTGTEQVTVDVGGDTEQLVQPAPAAPAPKATARKAKAAAAPKAPKAPAAPKAPKEPKLSARAQAAADALAGAEAGKLPVEPDFTAATHNSYRKKLEGIIAAAKANDLAALEADTTEPKCSSRIPLCRYRDLAIIAVKARLAKKAAKAG